MFYEIIYQNEEATLTTDTYEVLVEELCQSELTPRQLIGEQLELL